MFQIYYLDLFVLIEKIHDKILLILGEGDTGDHWLVVCDDEFWYRSKSVKLQHVDTKM